MAMVVAYEKKCDFIALSEPNISKCKINNKHQYVSQDFGAMIINFSKRYDVKKYRTSGCFICIETREISLYSVYISPNKCTTDGFISYLDNIQHDIKMLTSPLNKIIVTGDFNAKHTCWGGHITTKRGAELLEWTHSLELSILNDGLMPTCVRTNGTSYIDMTLVSENVLAEKVSWTVLEDDVSMSDHRIILTSIGKDNVTASPKYKFGKTNQGLFNATFRDLVKGKEIDYETCDNALKAAYVKSTPRVRCDDNYMLPYWWTQNIQDKIKETRAKRRKFQKCKEENRRELLEQQYKTCKNELKLSLKLAKVQTWNKLCDELEEDVFGGAYKIVKNQLQLPNPKTTLSLEEKKKAFNDLFIVTKCEEHKRVLHNDNEDLKDLWFTDKDIKDAADRIKNGKAPGPDSIPPEVIKQVVRKFPNYFVQLFNGLLETGKFPESWKVSKLILIDKPKKSPSEGNKYRPICLINVLAKLFERLINTRLIQEIDKNGGFHENQYGFRKGRTTIDALKQVDSYARQAKQECKWNGLILVDVRNAFNTASWPKIIAKLKLKKVSKYITNIVIDYLDQRVIQLKKGVRVQIGGGVPQGSVLGPTLWNILYDDVMSIEVPDGINFICYADDLAVSVTAYNADDLVRKGDEALHSIMLWMTHNRLEIAPEKTVAIIFNRRPRLDNFFTCGNTHIKPSSTVTYLGVTLDTRLIYGKHINLACEKSLRTITALAKLLPNTRGPSSRKRRTLALAMQSTVMYAAPIWVTAMDKDVHRRTVLNAQRTMALRTCCAYKTTSTEAALVLANLIPGHLLAKERAESYGLQMPEERRAVRERTFERWQDEWDHSTKGRWTHRLIGDVKSWVVRKHGTLTFRMTQCFTGHGVFMQYTERIKKRDNSHCMYCISSMDDAEHTLFQCSRFDRERQIVIRELGQNINVESLTSTMLESDKKWSLIQTFMESIMAIKEKDEIDGR